MSSYAWLEGLLRELAAVGTRSFVLCGGSRNSPILALLGSSTGLDLYSHFEEREAAFFALGMARRQKRPVALVTTSGTAVAEALPACVEAHYSGVPLVLITADRPRRYRSTGAPQSIEQAGLFGPYTELSLDVEEGEYIDLRHWQSCGPLHVNVCLDEPLLESAAPRLDFDETPDRYSEGSGRLSSKTLVQLAPARAQVQDFMSRRRKLLVLVGALDKEDRPAVAEFLAGLGAPVWAEGPSGLRENPSLSDVLLTSSERILAHGDFDGVLRLGSVPTARFWRDLERRRPLEVLSISSLPFSGLPGSRLVRAPVGTLLASVEFSASYAPANFRAIDRLASERIRELFARHSSSEPALVHQLSRRIPPESRVFLGNSLAIREWDLAADRRDRRFECLANRGANGIDGEVSTFLGLADARVSNWGLFGDLTTLYGLAAPWILPQLEEEPEIRLVVVNNGGGRIFGRLPSVAAHVPERVRRRYFECEHPLDFKSWARSWDLGYESWDGVLGPHEPGFRQGVIELRPNAEATAAFWAAYDSLWTQL